MIKLLFNEKILQWINKNKLTFIIIILVLGNAYQYTNGVKERHLFREDLKEERLRSDNANKNSLEFERNRSSSLEQLLSDILKMYSKIDRYNKTDTVNTNTKY